MNLNNRSARVGVGAGAAGVALSVVAILGAFSPNASAAESSTSTAASNGRGARFSLSAEQRACLEEQGLTARPVGRPTAAQREQFKAAADACGIERPANSYGKHGRGARGNRPQISAEQRDCLAEQGLTGRPEGRPTAEQREQFKAAAEACDVELPTRGGRGR